MRYSEREIRDLLTPKESPAPPAGLAERIKSEIPEHLETTPSAGTRFSRRFHQRTLLLAASVLATIGGAFLAYRVQRAPEPMALHRVTSTFEASDETGAASRGIPEPAVAASRIVPDTAMAPDSESETAAPDAREDSAAPVERKAAPVPAEREAAKPAIAYRGGSPRLEKRDPGYADDDAPAASGGEAVGRTAGSLGSGEKKLDGAMERDRLEPAPATADEAALEIAGALRERRQALAPESAAPPRGAPGPRAVDSEASEEIRVYSEAPRVDEPALREQTASFERSTFRPPDPVPARRANPNEAPYDAVYFRDYGTNPFIDTEDDALSTFGLDVDTASYAVVRRFLTDGHLPDPDAIRPEELINYFDYGDAPPMKGDFAIHAEGAPSPFGEGERYYLLRFHLQGRELDTSQRRPANLTFVVDTSGSMARENRLGLVREALGLLVDQLRDDDRVALVAYGSRAHVVLDATGDRERIRRALSELTPGGSTNAEEGLRLGYELAERAGRRGTINRVILCSDGVANVGATSAESILERVAGYAGRGIELTTVGFGMGNFNDVLLEQLADRGNGRYAYVDALDEARRIFAENLTGTLQTIAAEARVQVELNPRVVSRYRLVGYENRDIADQRFRDDTVDAGEIGAGHSVTALYEIKLRDDWMRREEIAILRLRYGSVVSGKIVETERTVTGADFAERWEASSRALRLTTLVAEFGEILKGSFWARSGDLDAVFRLAQQVAVEYPGDADVAEFVSLAGKAARYQQ